MLEGSRSSATRRSACEGARRWLVEYANEWRPTDERAEGRLRKALAKLADAVNTSDAAVLVKPGGLCPFCNMALEVLRKHAEGGAAVHSADLLHDEREALKLALADELASVLTFPVIFVRGRRLAGGFEELQDLHRQLADDGRTELHHALGGERRAFAPSLPPLPSASERPKLAHQAGGGRVLGFHTLLYGNVLRVIALLQVGVLGVCYALRRAGGGQPSVFYPLLLALLGADAALFVALGPSPFSPLGTLATHLVWRRRGAVASALPYKFTFALYAAALLLDLPCAFAASAGASSPSSCGFIGGEALLLTGMLNSTLLAAFRF